LKVDYYPFGLKHKGYNNQITGRDHNYGYGGKEENNELSLNWSDFGWRNYDTSLGRWMNIDPLAEKRHELTAYNYVQNSPLIRIDPNGLTDYKLNKKTGEITQVGEVNDKPDRIVKTNRKGEVKRYKRGEKKGQAKILIDDIEQGILKDGMNFKTESNIIAVGGEGQATEDGVEGFALKLSEHIGKEVGGTYFSKDGKDKITHIAIGKYKRNTHKSTKSKGITALIQFAGSGKKFNEGVRGFFHTHPSGGNIKESDRVVPSDTDLEARDNSLKINPNLRFYLITNPINYGDKYPYKIEYTTGYYKRMNKL